MTNNNGYQNVQLRRFVLVRHEDVSGVSGVGLVAEGVRFTDGGVALCWLRQPHQISFFSSVDDMLSVHGHNGKTELRWVDETPPDVERLKDVAGYASHSH